jgi:hypothetical protein
MGAESDNPVIVMGSDKSDNFLISVFRLEPLMSGFKHL